MVCVSGTVPKMHVRTIVFDMVIYVLDGKKTDLSYAVRHITPRPVKIALD